MSWGPEPMTPVSFKNDIAPMFSPYRGSMLWRLDLTNYEDVKANAALIYDQIGSKNMPPQPYNSFTPDQVNLFQAWMAQGFYP
jgi:hypothetical protein